MILSFILTAGILASLGLATWSFFSNNSLSKKYLGLVFLFLSFEVFYFYAELHDNDVSMLIGYFFSETTGILICPIIWIYTRAITNRPISKNQIPYHLIFPVVNFIGLVTPVTISFIQQEWVLGFYKTIANHYDYVVLPESIVSIIYLFISLKTISKHQENIKEVYSETQKLSLEWLRRFCLGGLLIVAIDILVALYVLQIQELSWNEGYITITGLSFLLFYLGYCGFKQQTVTVPAFVYEIKPQSTNDIVVEKERVYLKKFNDQEVSELRQHLEQIIVEKKIYQKPELVLQDLAKELSLTDKQTSELLNLELDTNFYDYINYHRVEEAKSGIASDEYNHLTLLAIGLNAGFQSKSSFNRVFKKSTGLSPSEYKKSLS